MELTQHTSLLLRSEYATAKIVIPTGKWKITNTDGTYHLYLEIIIPNTVIRPHKYWWQRKFYKPEYQLCSSIRWISETKLRVQTITTYVNKCGE